MQLQLDMDNDPNATEGAIVIKANQIQTSK